MNTTLKKYLLIAGIIGAGFGLRIYGLNWDQGHHLHPDERYVTIASNALAVPSSFMAYLDPAISPMNPYNKGTQIFVYGTLPMTLNKLLVAVIDKDTYNGATNAGRFLSAVFDTLTILMIFLICRLLERTFQFDPVVTYLAPALYAVTVLPIQLSHFFANDTFLCFFMTSSAYFALRVYENRRWVDVCVSSLLFGCALGTKISGIFVAPLLLFFLVRTDFQRDQSGKSPWFVPIARCGVFILITYLAFRIADPHVFASGNLLNPRPNPQFIQDIKQLMYLSSSKCIHYPPSIQWFNTPPVWFSVKNLARYGIGYAYFGFLLLGIVTVIRRKQFDLLMIVVWAGLFFLYQSTRFVKALRYFIFLYPYFAVFTAMGLLNLNKIKNTGLRRLSWMVAMILILLWPISFMHIYTQNHSRIDASYWIHANIPANAFLAEEYWDDWLPVVLPDVDNRTYTGKQMQVFMPDCPRKTKEMEDILAQADYIILTSNRGYGAIPHLPKIFPYMNQFYDDLFAGRREFKKVAEFSSYPTLNLGFLTVAFQDDDADETFTVYDHPKVTIFKKVQQ